MKKRYGFVAAAIAALFFAVTGHAFACATPATAPGHWEWQGDGHVWVPAHATLPPNVYSAAYARLDPHALRAGPAPSRVRDAARDRDERDARDQPGDLDRRLAR
jgi:hypothetical protein